MDNRTIWIAQEGPSETSVVLGSMMFETVDCKMEQPEANTVSDMVHEPQCFGEQPVTSSSSDYIKEDPELNLGVNSNDDNEVATTYIRGNTRSSPLTLSTATGHIASFSQFNHEMSEEQQNTDAGPSLSGEGSEKKAMEALEKQHAREKILSGDWVVRVKTGRRTTSPGWEKFGEIFERSTNRYTGFVQCFSCSRIKIFKKGMSPSWLSKHQCIRPNAIMETRTGKATCEMKNRFRDACVNLSAGDIQPFTTFTGRCFTDLVQVCIDLGAKYGCVNASELLCDPTTISDAVALRANAAKDEVLPEVLKAVQKEHVAATADFWTENLTKNHYLTLTVHYIDNNWKLINRVLFTRKFSHEFETSEDINEGILQEIEKIGITPEMLRTVTFVTDGNENIVKALSLMKVQHLYCSAHCLNAILKSTFTLKLADLNLYGDAAQKIVDLTRLVIAYARYSDKCFEDSLIEVPSQTARVFKSSIPALESLNHNFGQVCRVLRQGDQKNLERDLQKHFNDLRELVNFMKPIESAARACGNDLEYIDLNWLSQHIGENTEESSFLTGIKTHVRNELAVLDCLQLIHKCKQIVTLFRCLGVGDQLGITLKQDIDTGWKSKLLMLFSFPRNFEKINRILETHSKHHLILSSLEQQAILELVSFLSTLKTETDKMEAERTPAAQYVFLSFSRLLKHCTPVDSESVAMSNMKCKLRFQLHQKFVPHILQKVAVFLWPQFRRLKMLTQEERNEVHAEIRKLWVMIPFEANAIEPVIRSCPKRSRDDGYDEWRDSDEEEEDEIGAYLRDRPGDDQDLLKWWQSKEHRYPKLANVAQKILAIPATCTTSERVFSTKAQLFAARLSNVYPTDVDNILFLNSYLRNIHQRRNKTK